jgi:hypothetical protein
MTPAERWAIEAHALVEADGPDGIARLLTDDFVQETYRVQLQGTGTGFLETVRSMREMGLHVSGRVIATAGDFHVLTHREYHHPTSTVTLLAISEWTAEGRLRRLIEFNDDDTEHALEVLADVAGLPVVRVGPIE